MTKHVTVTLDETAATAFGELSAQSGEPVNVLVNEVLAGWLDVREGQLAAIRAGLAQLDRGDTVSHEEMERLAASYSAP
jgi:predicted transcriptional regulator